MLTKEKTRAKAEKTMNIEQCVAFAKSNFILKTRQWVVLLRLAIVLSLVYKWTEFVSLLWTLFKILIIQFIEKDTGFSKKWYEEAREEKKKVSFLWTILATRQSFNEIFEVELEIIKTISSCYGHNEKSLVVFVATGMRKWS